MAKYLLLKHYRGAPVAVNDVAMDQWAPAEVDAHIQPRTRSKKLRLYFLCAHPELTPSSAVALTLRAVGGLTTRQIAAHLHERNGDLDLAADLYAQAARDATNVAERDHQTRQAARINQLRRERG